MIIVLDFGSQYSHLITRRIRELGVFSELVSPDTELKRLKQAEALVLSGGPQNLSEQDALRVDKKIFDLNIPVLGICYGLQLMAFELGGKVSRGRKREYGPARIEINKQGQIFKGLNSHQMTWMSHGDKVSKLPKGFEQLASSKNCKYAAIANPKKKLYGLQFHPEVVHTENGKQILENFITLTKAKRGWQMEDFIESRVKKIKTRIGEKDKVVCALSGGIDSAVAATLVHQAIGDQLICFYVDTGLMRKNETGEIKTVFKDLLHLNLKIVDEEKTFLAKLQGVTDPEKKRKIIGELFIQIFEREAKKIKNAKWLIQGTLYTDAITSGVSVGKQAAVIKSHHNVGGLPEKMDLKLIEPLRELYKDEVRKIGRLLKLPKSLTDRQPFPGPGLAVRIIGEVTNEKLKILREADAVVREEIEKNKLDKKIQQYFAVLPSIKSVGVQGDARSYGHAVIVRAVTTTDFMTAHWAKIPNAVLEKISVRITNEIPNVNRVVYDITSKPPGTVEWE